MKIGQIIAGVLFSVVVLALLFTGHKSPEQIAAEATQARVEAEQASKEAAHAAAVEAAKQELAEAERGLEDYPYPLPDDWGTTSGATKPAYVRERVATFARWEKAQLAANGPNWKSLYIKEMKAKRIQDAKDETEDTKQTVMRLSVGDDLRMGLPIVSSEVQDVQPDTSPIVIPSSADMTPFSKAMNVRYQAADDQSFDEDAEYLKLKAASDLVEQGKGIDDWSEYLRCELSYAIHGGYVSKRPVAKPCERFVDKVIGQKTSSNEGEAGQAQ